MFFQSLLFCKLVSMPTQYKASQNLSSSEDEEIDKIFSEIVLPTSLINTVSSSTVVRSIINSSELITSPMSSSATLTPEKRKNKTPLVNVYKKKRTMDESLQLSPSNMSNVDRNQSDTNNNLNNTESNANQNQTNTELNTNNNIINTEVNNSINIERKTFGDNRARTPSGAINIFPYQKHHGPNEFEMKISSDDYHITTKILPLPNQQIMIEVVYHFHGMPFHSFNFKHRPSIISNLTETPNITTEYVFS